MPPWGPAPVPEAGRARAAAAALGFELADEGTGAQLAMLDLAWPEGLQPGLSTPVAVLLNEPPEVPFRRERIRIPVLHNSGGVSRVRER